MGVQLQNHQILTCFEISQKVQLTYKLFLLENAHNVLNKQLDKMIKEAYEEVHRFINSSFPASTFMNLSETLDAKCQAIKTLSDVLNNFASHKVVDNQVSRNLQNKAIKEESGFKFVPMLQNIGKVVQVLGSSLYFQHLKHLFIRPKSACRDEKVILSQSVISEVPEMGAMCSALSSHNTTEQDAATLIKTEQSNVEKCSPPEEILLPAFSDDVKANCHKLLLPPIPTSENCHSRPYLGVPMAKWGREDDIQVQHQKQTSSQLLHFLKVKAKNTGALNVTVLEWRNMFSGLPPPLSSPDKNIIKQACQFKQDVAWSSGLLSEAENHASIFKVKRLDSDGSLTYTCVIATKTELWDIGDIVTDLESENSSMSGEETAQILPSDETLKWIDATVQKDEATKMHTSNTITIPEFQNKRFEEMEVVVSHIVDPGNFYIQHTDAIEKLQTLFSNTCKENGGLAKQKWIPDIGTKVIGWFPQHKKWCRSQVTKICGVSKDDLNDCTMETSIQLEVKRLDFGDSLCLSLSNIKELTSEMAALPLQAVQVSLAHVSPVNGRNWSDEAVAWFRHMVHKRTLYARLYPEGLRICVDLFLEKGTIHAMRRGASLSLRLTQNGHAKHAKLKNGVGTMQLKMKKKELEWEKYLISCYTQSNLHKAVY